MDSTQFHTTCCRSIMTKPQQPVPFQSRVNGYCSKCPADLPLRVPFTNQSQQELKMPIYEYRCEKCGKEFEEWQKFSDPVVDKCPTCGGKSRKLISRSTFALKGTGWYVTDYGRKDSSSSTQTPPKECSSETETSETKTTSSDAGQRSRTKRENTSEDSLRR